MYELGIVRFVGVRLRRTNDWEDDLRGIHCPRQDFNTFFGLVKGSLSCVNSLLIFKGTLITGHSLCHMSDYDVQCLVFSNYKHKLVAHSIWFH